MISISRPGAREIHSFLAAQSRLGYSYREVGLSEDGRPAGYDLDHNRVRLGEGQAAFEAACMAIRGWRMFPRPWMEIHPAGAPIQAGTDVAVLCHAFGLWWANGARIVYTVDEAAPVRRFGFAYGTLPSHMEQGEERFTVEWAADGSVWYDLRAFSRPRLRLVRLGYPLVRRLQRRFVLESQAAMREATG